MEAMSDFLESAVLNSALNAVAFPTIASVYVALFTVAPNDTGGGTEVPLAANYGREQVTSGFSLQDLTTRFSNDSPIVFPAAGSGGWGSITSVGLFDAVTGGNLLFHGNLTNPRTVLEFDVFQFNADDLGITLA